MAVKPKRNQPATARRARNTKFQADLALADDRALRTLKEELQLRSNTDFLSDAVAIFRWAVSERRLGHRIIAETLTGQRNVLVFPRLERVASADPQPPNEALLRAVRD
jgi:hypothetical protein